MASKSLVRSMNRKVSYSFSVCKTASLSTSSASPLPSRITSDICIIGGGPVGSSIALHLAQLSKGDRKIVVVERDNSYRSGSAMLSAGGVRQQFSVPENIKMSMYGADFLKNMNRLQVDDEVPDIQFFENGYLFLGNDRSVDIMKANHKIQRECGADWIDLLNKQELEQKFSWLNTDDIAMGSYGNKNEGYFDPWSLVQALKKKAISLGVEYIEGSVTGGEISLKSKSTRAYNLSHVTVQNKVTKKDTKLVAHTFVNAAGAWAGRLIDTFTSSFTRNCIMKLPVQPRKRCIFTIHCPGLQVAAGDKPVPPSTTPLVIDPTGVYFRPEGKGNRFIVGVSPTEDKDPNCDDNDLKVVDHHLFEDIIWPTLYNRVPAFAEIKVQSSWAGFYEYNTLDQNAIIGYHSDIQNLMLCNGFSGHGLQQSLGAGRGVSELLYNGNKYTTLDLSRFSFDRVVDGKPILETGIV